jgi:hypothetical protein
VDATGRAAAPAAVGLRAARAAAEAEDGQAIQFLAGAPELLARYRTPPPPRRR